MRARIRYMTIAGYMCGEVVNLDFTAFQFLTRNVDHTIRVEADQGSLPISISQTTIGPRAVSRTSPINFSFSFLGHDATTSENVA